MPFNNVLCNNEANISHEAYKILHNICEREDYTRKKRTPEIIPMKETLEALYTVARSSRGKEFWSVQKP